MARRTTTTIPTTTSRSMNINLNTTRRSSVLGATGTSSVFSSSRAAAPTAAATARRAGAPPTTIRMTSPSPSAIAQEWMACFGPGGASDFFSPEDPRSILGITPRQVRDRLDTQTREVETLRREMTEMRKQMKEERKQLQQQVNSFAAAARATARQETSLKSDALSLAKMRHQRELARLAGQHEQEVATLKAKIESFQKQQQQQPQQQEEVFYSAPAAQQTQTQQQQPSATSWSTTRNPPPEVPYGSTFASATSPFPAAPYNTARTATFRRTTPAAAEEEMKTTASPIATTRATTRSTIRGGRDTHSYTQAHAPEIAPNHGMPLRSDQELTYLKERLVEIQELYNVMQAAFQEGGGAEEEETKWGMGASSAGGGMVLDPSLGGIDVYPTEPTVVGEEGGRRRGGSAATTTATMRRTGGVRTRAFSTTTTTTAASKGTISDAPYTRLDPTMYTAMSKTNTPMTSRRPSSTAMHMNESQDIRDIFGRAPSLPPQEQEQEQEQEEEIEDVQEEEGGNEVVSYEDEDEGSWLDDEGEEEETEETESEEEEEESSEEESSEEEDSGEDEF